MTLDPKPTVLYGSNTALVAGSRWSGPIDLTTTAPERGELEVAGRRLCLCRPGQNARTRAKQAPLCSEAASGSHLRGLSGTLLPCGGWEQTSCCLGLGASP